MKDKNRKTFVIFTLAFFLLSVPVIIFQTRDPVLIVSEESFLNYFGRKRLEKEAFFNSLILFRNILTVEVANDASDDLIALAVHGISKKPYCVLFPLRFSTSALIYNEQNPDVRTVILEGRNTGTAKVEDIINIFKYKTDIDTDFFKAGFLASSFKLPPAEETPAENPVQAAAEDTRKRTIAFFMEIRLNNTSGTKIQESFMAGMKNQHENTPEVRYFTSFSDYSAISDLSCIILAGTGSEFLENKQNVPIIVFTWLDPALITSNVTVIVDDSPWAQAVQSVRYAENGIKEGLINSNFLILDKKKFSRSFLRKIKKLKQIEDFSKID